MHRPPPPPDLKQFDKKLKARGLTLYVSDLRNCTTREQEEERVFQELANIRSKFSQKSKQLSSYDRRKYVWKLVYTHLLGYDVDIGHMQAIELLAGSTFPEKMCGYLALSVLLPGSHELVKLVVNTIKQDLTQTTQEAVQCLALAAIANIGGREMAHTLGEDVRRIAQDKQTCVSVKKKAILALLRIHRENPDAVRVPSELDIASLLEPGPSIHMGLSLSACALLKHLISYANEQEKMGHVRDLEEDDPEEEQKRILRIKQRPQIQACVVRMFHTLAVNRMCPQQYFYHGTAAPFLQVCLLQILIAIGDPPQTNELKVPLFEGLKRTLTGVKWSKSSTMNNSSRCVAFEAISLIVLYGQESRSDLIASSIELLGKFVASKNANTRYLALSSMGNIAKTIAGRYSTPEQIASDQWQKALSVQQEVIVSSLKDPDNSVRKQALNLLYNICDQDNAKTVIDELLLHLGRSDDLPPAFKEEMVLRIAVLAERFAKTSKSYLDICIRLIDVGAEHVGDNVWHRVIQIITNTEELQTYAALRMYRALLGQGHVADSMVKAASYVIGEFGYLLTEYSALDEGDLDHDVMAIDLFGACHRHFALVEPKTKVILLTTYSKLLNVYEDLEEPVREVFESQLKATDAEIQQRAFEYLALSKLSVEAMNQVLEPMPPWSQENSAKSKLVEQLQKMSEGTSDSTAPVGAGSSSSVPSNEKVWNKSVKRKQGEQDLLDFETISPSPPRPSPASPSVRIQKETQHFHLNALLSNKSLLYEDGSVQIGSHQTFHQGSGSIELFIGNLSSTSDISRVRLLTSNGNNADKLKMVPPPEYGSLFDIQACSQVKFHFQVMAIGPFVDSPELIVLSQDNGHHLCRCKFPLAITSFIEPYPLTGEQFEQKWHMIGNNSVLSETKGVDLSHCAAGRWSQAVGKTSRLLDLIHTSTIKDWPTPTMQNPNVDHDLASSGVFHTSSNQIIGILIRVEIAHTSMKALISVRASQPGVASSVLVVVFNQITRLFG